MKRALLAWTLAVNALTAAAHDNFLVDLRAPAGTGWTVSTRDAQRSGTMPAEGSLAVSIFGYLTHDGREVVDATYGGPGGACPQIVMGVYEPSDHFEQSCRPTFVYDGASCVSSCPASPPPPPPGHGAAADPLAFPNPLRAGGEMHFQNLPANARVRIYSSAGRLVFEQTIAGDGHMSWHAHDAGGRPVGSGIYHVVAKGESGTVTLSVAIQR